jgi:hypothetical protein
MTDTSPQQLPPQAQLYHLAIGHYFSHALSLAARLGIADQLGDGPCDARQLATALGLNPDALRRVMRLLVSVGVFEERADGAFALTSLGECLRTDVPGGSRNMVMLFSGERIQESWRDLEYCVRTGDPAYRKRGVTDSFAEMAKDPQTAAVFDAAMADFTKVIAIVVAGAYDFSGLKTIVDVGGGNGALLLGILSAHPHLRGTVFDQPHVIARAKQQIAERGLGDRCQAVGGSFFESVPEGADAYVLKHVIHDWNDEDAIRILANCRRAMAKGAKLLIVEGVYPPHVDQSLGSRGAAANDVNMLVNTGGRQRSEAEFRALYEAAGFELTRLVPTPMAVNVIEGIRAA